MNTELEREQKEREFRQQYKDLILDATRIAVRGGLLSEAYEDFVIDYLDLIIDPLSNDDFDYLAKNGRFPARAIPSDIALQLLSAARKLRKEPSLTDMDLSNLKGYTETLEALLRESEGPFSSTDSTAVQSEIDQLRARIFKAADVLDAMDPDDARLPEYKRLYQALWDKYNKLQKQGG